MERKEVAFSGVKPFDLSVTLQKNVKPQYQKTTKSHIHDICEIYVNISGDVSFMVENKVFTISHGDVIITINGKKIETVRLEHLEAAGEDAIDALPKFHFSLSNLSAAFWAYKFAVSSTEHSKIAII